MCSAAQATRVSVGRVEPNDRGKRQRALALKEREGPSVTARETHAGKERKRLRVAET